MSELTDAERLQTLSARVLNAMQAAKDIKQLSDLTALYSRLQEAIVKHREQAGEEQQSYKWVIHMVNDNEEEQSNGQS